MFPHCQAFAAIVGRMVRPGEVAIGIDSGDPAENSWKTFQQQQMRDIVDVVHTYGAIAVACFWVAFVAACFLQYGVPTWADDRVNIMIAVCCGAIGLSCFGFTSTRLGMWCKMNVLNLRDCYKGDYQEWYYCIAHSSLLLNLTVIAFFCQIFAVPVELDRQKAFISAYFIYLAFAMAQCYLPLRWHLLFVTFPAMCYWYAWHWATGYLALGDGMWGIVWPAIEVLGFRVFESREWARYQARSQAVDASALSEAYRMALQSMLSSVFDASCECDPGGKILATSPQWQQLFGEQCLSLNLTALAASPEEAMRIGFLLEQSTQQSGTRASPCAKIETSLRCPTQCQKEHVLRMTLCCVAFPFDSSVASSGRILIGCQQAHQTDKIPQETYLSETPAPIGQASGMHRKLLLQRLKSFIDPVENPDFDVKSMSTFSPSLTNSYCSQPISSIAVATQTEGLAPMMQTEANAQDVGTQMLPAHQHPRQPPPDLHAKRAFKAHRRRDYKPAVTLSTRKCALKQFRETPKGTIIFIISQIMQQINPRGKGCCFFHISLQTLYQGLFELIASECRHHITPCIGWQCKYCFALHPSEEEEDDDDKCCHVCFHANADAHTDDHPAFLCENLSKLGHLDDGDCASFESAA